MHLHTAVTGLAGWAFLASTAAALPSAANSDYVLHESRHVAHSALLKRSARADGSAIIPLRISLAQANVHLGHDRLMDVADPNSANFGKHLTEDEVIELFAPEKKAADAVGKWLVDSGIARSNIKTYKNKGWLAVDLPIAEVERLFKTQYHEIELDGNLHLGCDEYHVPRHLSDHIDFVMPAVKLSASIVRREIEIFARGEPKAPAMRRATTPPPPFDYQSLAHCGADFTVACYRALYGIPEPALNSTPLAGHELGLYEDGDTYAQEDLNLYYAQLAPYVPNGTHPLLASINGAPAPVPQNQSGSESMVDLSIIQPLIYPQKIVLYQNNDRPTASAPTNSSRSFAGIFNTFLDALDGSYCNLTAFNITGDSPGIDPTYPDPLPGGYAGPRMCGTYAPTSVISISYGQTETVVPAAYARRQCLEFMKLGLRGITVLTSSGDYGVGPNQGPAYCLGPQKNAFAPHAPTTCPYVTSVGATQLSANATVGSEPEGAMQTALAPAPLPQSLFASGGGFSNYFARPEYQQKAVDAYFARHDPGHRSYVANADATNIGAGGGLYNRAGRAYPDVSANGANFRMVVKGRTIHEFGTSLATPAWASMISIVNERRGRECGKGPVGFLNPTLYEERWWGEMFTDIVRGANPNCNSTGFRAVEGWDPITGLGTPKFAGLERVLLDLP